MQLDRIEKDRKLAERIVKGEDRAFEELISLFHRQVWRIAGRFFRQREILEDITQEVYMKAFLSMKDYRGEVPLEHWLSKITINACYDSLRRKKKRPETLLSEITSSHPEFFDRLFAPEESALDPYWHQEDVRMHAETILSILEPADRIVLTLLVLEEKSVSEVATLTGWSRANVKVRAFRARNKLKKILRAKRP